MDSEVQPENVQNNEQPTPKMLGGITGKGFMPGQSGNPAGKPKRKPITDLFDELMSDPELVAQFKTAIANSIKKGGMAGVMYMKEAADRLEGKVTQPIEADITMSSLSERMAKAAERIKE
jgi:hypothetical protein